MNTTQSFLDKAEFVERYSWFGAMKGGNEPNPVCFYPFIFEGFFFFFDDFTAYQNIATMNDNGKINALGTQYIGSSGPQINGEPASALNREFSFLSSSALLFLLVSLDYL
jgi:hypothetical protein